VGQLKAIYPDEAKNVTVRVELEFVNGYVGWVDL
jgi:hypothetical protein